jgi:hypothetical protein
VTVRKMDSWPGEPFQGSSADNRDVETSGMKTPLTVVKRNDKRERRGQEMNDWEHQAGVVMVKLVVIIVFIGFVRNAHLPMLVSLEKQEEKQNLVNKNNSSSIRGYDPSFPFLEG